MDFYDVFQIYFFWVINFSAGIIQIQTIPNETRRFHGLNRFYQINSSWYRFNIGFYRYENDYYCYYAVLRFKIIDFYARVAQRQALTYEKY